MFTLPGIVRWRKLGNVFGTVEYAHATSVNASTKLTRFEIDTGRIVSNLIAHENKEYDGMDPQHISEFASKFAKDHRDLVRKARESPEQAQERQMKTATLKEQATPLMSVT